MIKNVLRHIRDELQLPSEHRAARKLDRLGETIKEIAPAHEYIKAGANWLMRAQDLSATRDGGCARHFHVTEGWSASYPETSGYIIPTLLAVSSFYCTAELRQRAKKMLDWLISIQFADGGFQGGMVNQTPKVPVTFNTGQILLGLVAGYECFGNGYLAPVKKAADWLANTQDKDGAWRAHATPFAKKGDKAYETHVSWGLFEAARITRNEHYLTAALRNIYWAISKQEPNGFVRDCCLLQPDAPLTHTLGYYLRGLVEAYLATRQDRILTAAMKTAQPLAQAIDEDGFLAGRLDSNFESAADWSCLTGSVQIAHSLILLSDIVSDKSFLNAAIRANNYVKARIDLDATPDTMGAVKGSFPIDGEFCAWEYPNCSTKFFIDSVLAEEAATATKEAPDRIYA